MEVERQHIKPKEGKVEYDLDNKLYAHTPDSSNDSGKYEYYAAY
jgi:hypothetical protein